MKSPSKAPSTSDANSPARIAPIQETDTKVPDREVQVSDTKKSRIDKPAVKKPSKQQPAAPKVDHAKKADLPDDKQIDLAVINRIQSEPTQNEMDLFFVNLGEDAKNSLTKKGSSWYAKSYGLNDFNKWFHTSLGYCNSLKDLTKAGISRETIKASVSISPIKYFFIGATFVYDLNGYENQYYQPDFSYSFGYSDWHPGTFGILYSNYADNKVFPHRKQDRFHFDEGTWELNYKDRFDKWSWRASLKYIRKSDSKVLTLAATSLHYKRFLATLTYDHAFHYPQDRFTFSDKTFIYKKFFVSGSIYYYTNPGRQTFLEPDYAYSFGWYDPRPYYPTITYSNYYTPTRWWWRDGPRPYFDDGQLCVTVNF